MTQNYVGEMSTDSTLPKHQEMHICDPHRDLLGHIVCKEGIKVDFAKIKIILDLKPLVNPKQVRVLLGHTGYYRKFIRYYSDMTYPLEELLRKDQEFNQI